VDGSTGAVRRAVVGDSALSREFSAVCAEDHDQLPSLVGLELDGGPQSRAGVDPHTDRSREIAAEAGRRRESPVSAEELPTVRGPGCDPLTNRAEGDMVREDGVEMVTREDRAQLRIERGVHLVLGMLAHHPNGPLDERGNREPAGTVAQIGDLEKRELDGILLGQAKGKERRDPVVLVLE
jgi:hypothetical protein